MDVSYRTADDCEAIFASIVPAFNLSDPHCNATWDGILCWPATKAGLVARRLCPPFRAFDASKFATRRCSLDGLWTNKFPGDTSRPNGWTNFTDCYLPHAKTLYDTIYANKTPETKEAFKTVIKTTRVLEVAGSSISLLALLISICIFCYFRSLRCNRTNIHVNLFSAMTLHMLIRLIIKVDQFVPHALSDVTTVRDTPVVCEFLYSLMEYANTVVFMWMFLEGFYLHSMITFTNFCTGTPNLIIYGCLAWGIPLIVTTSWSVTQGILYNGTATNCWYMYTFSPRYWMLQGPRAAIILVNLIFLLNIVRILFTKLRNSRLSEAQQVRKAMKAALVLLPLLGITNAISMTGPSYDNVISFGAWSYGSSILVDFQGLYLSILYCFLNAEVRSVIKRKVNQLRYSKLGVKQLNFSTINSTGQDSRRGSKQQQVKLYAPPKVQTHNIKQDRNGSYQSASSQDNSSIKIQNELESMM